MSKVKILIDLDDTILNTGRLRRNRWTLIKQFSRNKAELLAGRGPAIPDPYNIEIFSRRLFPKDKVRAKTFANALNVTLDQSAKYVYPGAIKFLSSLSKKYDLILLTYGDKDMQRKKIKYTGFDKYFSQIIITDDHSKKSSLLKLRSRHGNNLIMIDNAPEVCALARRLGLSSVRIRTADKDWEYYRNFSIRIDKAVKHIGL